MRLSAPSEYFSSPLANLGKCQRFIDATIDAIRQHFRGKFWIVEENFFLLSGPFEGFVGEVGGGRGVWLCVIQIKDLSKLLEVSPYFYILHYGM